MILAKNKLQDFKIVAPDNSEYKLTELVVIKDVCDAFGVTSMTVYNWLGSQNPATGFYDQGRFPHAFKLGNGGGIYIPISEFNEAVKQRNKELRAKQKAKSKKNKR